MTTTRRTKPNTSSGALFKRAQKVIPGGVNSPVRAFGAVGGTPVFFKRGQGARLYSADAREFIDFCGSWGPLILGHAHPAVVDAIQRAAADGTSFGANTEREVEMAEFLRRQIPCLDMVRLVSSGTEAAMTALRLARGYTGRNKVLKFDGCYHGHADYLLVSAGSGLLTGGIASSAGVTESAAAEVLVSPYNDIKAASKIVDRHGADIAAIIVEPIAGNMGLAPPKPGFLEGLRKITRNSGAVLIFDEVITGFRLAPTTYGTLCGVTPDLTCLGKIIGGGLPIGAVGGRKDIMQCLAPLGRVYQAGTLSGNPVAVAAGLATLRILKNDNPYPVLEQRGAQVAKGLNAAAREHNVKMRCAALGGMFTPFFGSASVTDLKSAKLCDTRAYAKFFHGMLDRGIYLPPSQFEVGFISTAHTKDDIQAFIRAASDALRGRI